MKVAANLSLLWPELPYLDRFEAAARAGFEAVEVLFPYDVAVKETERALIANGLRMILINAPPPNYTGGDRGFASEPHNVGRFRYDLRRSIRYAQALRVPMIHVMAGTGSGDAARQTMIDNLRWAASEAPKGLTFTIEPLNERSKPGYFLNDYDLAAEILDAVDADCVGLQYDSYHAQMIHGDAVEVFDAHRDRIRHIQLGDAPDRSTPGTGTVDFSTLFGRIAASGYRGYLSAEYHPNGATEASFDWRAAL